MVTFYYAIYYLFSQIVNTQIRLNMFVGFEHACVPVSILVLIVEFVFLMHPPSHPRLLPEYESWNNFVALACPYNSSHIITYGSQSVM